MPEPFLDRIREATVDPTKLDLEALQGVATSVRPVSTPNAP